MRNKVRVGVLMGGISTEREISIKSGKEVLRGLSSDKYIGVEIIWEPASKWIIDKKHLSLGQAIDYIKHEIDVVFIALHGKYGEDGSIQGLFDIAGIKYTGSGVLSSAIGMDKVFTQELMEYHGLKLPAFKAFPKGIDLSHIKQQIEQQIKYPCVLKPADGGSSAATFLLKSEEGIEEKIALAFEVSNLIMAQTYIKGDEVSCGVLEIDGKLKVLPPIQIIPQQSSFFDMVAKYDEGVTKEIVPTLLSEVVNKKIQEIARACHLLLRCAGYSRTDVIVTPKGELYILEINTLPGMTATSLLPKEAAAIGIPFQELLDRLVQFGLKSK